MPIRAIVTDIEGTTSSISFVKDVLFPYAAEHLESYIQSHLDDPSVQQQLKLTAQEAAINEDNVPALIQQLLQWIKEDKKATPLKTLQGLIWEAGYKNGDYQAHVYTDATALLKQWHDQGIPLYVYSSGSVYAQKLFFGYSQDGDLLPLFHGHFDTQIGHKQEAQSYRNIQNTIGLPENEILFLSDIKQELDAAKSIGMHTVWLVRDENQSLDSSEHQAVRSFDQITFEE